MTKINLLPWREEQRKEQQRQFISITVGAVVLMAALDAFVWVHTGSKIRAQDDRVKYLTKVSKDYDRKIAQIKNIEEEEEKLKKRIEVIETLQSSRPEIVKVFDDLARLMPNGLYLTAMENAGNSITMRGFAESNATVSSFMRNLDHSKWFTNPNLGSIESVMQNHRRMSKFSLKVRRPARSDKEEKPAGKKAGNKV